MASRSDPYRNIRFRVEIDGVQLAGFTEVAIGETTTDVIDYREGSDPPHVRKLPGLRKFGNVTLKRGFTESLELWNWFASVGQGPARKHLAIVVLDEAGADKARFVVTNAWPIKYQPSDLKACADDVLFETLVMTNEGVERVA